LIEFFLNVEGHQLAFVTQLNIVHMGPNDGFDDLITAEFKRILFEDYLSFREDSNSFSAIFCHQIKHVCCNLSNCSCNLLTLQVNNIESE